MNIGKRYVQHKSGEGEKWEVTAEYASCWSSVQNQSQAYFLPKSEYILADPPEEYEDITEHCTVHPTGRLFVSGRFLDVGEERLRKIDGLHHGPAFIVERKKT